MNIIVVSFFNSNNIGDLAIVEMIKKELSQFNIIEIDISGKKPIVRVADSTVKASVDSIVPKARFYHLKSFLSLFRNNRVKYLKQVICHADYVLFAGGNMMMDTEIYPVYSVLCNRYIRVINKNKIPYGFAFVGVGPTGHGIHNWLWKRATNKARFIAVRDSYSREYLEKKIGVRKAISIWQDPVLGLKNTHKNGRSSKVAINIYTKCSNNESLMVNFYNKLVLALAEKYSVYLFTTELQDVNGMHTVYKSFENKGNVQETVIASYQDLVAFYSDIDFLVATRMHSLIIGISQKIPSAVISWQRKIDGLMADLNLQDWLYPVKKIDDNAAQVISDIQSRIDAYPNEIERIDQVYELIQQRHEQNFITLKEVLK